MVGPQAVGCWLGESHCPGVPECRILPSGTLGGLTCLSEMLMGSRSTIQVTLSVSGGVVREPG